MGPSSLRCTTFQPVTLYEGDDILSFTTNIMMMKGFLTILLFATLVLTGVLPELAAQNQGPASKQPVIITDSVGNARMEKMEKMIVRTMVVSDSTYPDRPAADKATRTITITIDDAGGREEKVLVLPDGNTDVSEIMESLPKGPESQHRILRMEADEFFIEHDQALPGSPDRIHWVERQHPGGPPQWSEEEELIEEMDGDGVVRKRISRKRTPQGEEEMMEEMDGDGVVTKRTVRTRKFNRD